MIDVIEFFKTLPKKKCRNCGKKFDEKADCSMDVCDKCDSPTL